jgi:hypothetical protein
MKIVILGAGLSGCLAAEMFKAHDVTMVAPPSSSVGLQNHKAVMRIKDPTMAMILGVVAKKILVSKGIRSKGEFVPYASIRDSNLYSLKLYGYIGNKSILDTKTVERHLMVGEIVPRCKVIPSSILRIKKGSILLKGQKVLEYDFCISTLPMFVNCKLTGLSKLNQLFNTAEITILNWPLGIPTSNTYQTIYYPDLETPLYRATLQDGTIISEIIGGTYWHDKIRKELEASFGILLASEPEAFTQKNGKMHSIDETARKKIIYSLTDKFNLFSLGRYSIWKQIRADDLLSDVNTIVSLSTLMDPYLVAKKRARGGK